MMPLGLRKPTGHSAVADPFPVLNNLWVLKHLVGLTPTPNTPVSGPGLFILSPPSLFSFRL